MTDSKGAAIKEQILKIVNDNRCNDHRCSRVADLNENAAKAILAILAQELKTIEDMTHDGRGTILWEMDNIATHINKRIKDLERLG